MYQTIFVGVFSGVLTAVVLYLIGKLFKHSFLPWYQQKNYQGVNVSGKWHWCIEGQQKIQLELRQFARNLSGTYTVFFSAEQPGGSIHTYKVTGEITDRFVQLSLKNNDETKLGAMVYLLEVVGDGSELKGCCTSYASDSHEVFSMSQSFFRTESQSIDYSRVHYGTSPAIELEADHDDPALGSSSELDSIEAA